MISTNPPDRAEMLLRSSRRSLTIVLALVLLMAATVIAHVLRPGSLLADWASRMPWLLPVAIAGLFVFFIARLPRPFRPDHPDVKRILNDEFRQANLARAQRAALVTVLVAQIPLAVLVSGLTVTSAVTIMAVATGTVAMTTLITSFLYFDRD